MKLAPQIDHTLLKPNSHRSDILQCCREAMEFQFAAVCVPPFFVKDAANVLEDSLVKVATVVGFPFGFANTPAKVEEIKRAVGEGADELDVVVNINAVKNEAWSVVKNDIDSLTRSAHLRGKTIKVILETGLLSHGEILKLCGICTELEVDYVKTSTGFNGLGASVEVVTLLRNHLPESIKIKASGGIRTLRAARELIHAGANRLGTSASVEIIKEELDVLATQNPE